MREDNRLPFPGLPLRTVVSANGIVGTVVVGSMADYLERMEQWLLQERDHATDAAERADAEAALQSIRRQRQQLTEVDAGDADGEEAKKGKRKKRKK